MEDKDHCPICGKAQYDIKPPLHWKNCCSVDCLWKLEMEALKKIDAISDRDEFGGYYQ
jgi:hypothetical protein